MTESFACRHVGTKDPPFALMSSEKAVEAARKRRNSGYSTVAAECLCKTRKNVRGFNHQNSNGLEQTMFTSSSRVCDRH